MRPAADLRFPSITRRIWERRSEWQGKAIGAAIGLTAGWFGVIVGVIIGYLTDELLKQWRADRALVSYLELPGPVPFYEPAPGAAAFCALAALIAAPAPSRRYRKTAGVWEGFGISDRIARKAAEAFRLRMSVLPILETFVRVASLRLDRLNPDLLAESLAARRRELRDFPAILDAVSEFASGVGGIELIARIRAAAGPAGGSGGTTRASPGDPWAVLGLEREASMDEVKAAFRRLAVDMHPDSIPAGNEGEKKAAAEAFMRIEAAYREIARMRGAG